MFIVTEYAALSDQLRQIRVCVYILGQKRNAAYNNKNYCELNESGKFHLLFMFCYLACRTFPHCFIEVSQSKPVY